MEERNQISENRRILYYLGLILATGGYLLSFGSIGYAVFHFSSHRFFNPQQIFVPFFIGMAAAIVGQVLKKIGARGVAGSGLKLDPEEAREDIKPWAHMAGGILNDAGIDLKSKNEKPAPAAPYFDEKLRKLHQLHADGILEDHEYAEQKSAILDSLKNG